MGDDIVDLPVLARVGLAAAPADAVDEVRARVHWVSRCAGGDGAARELDRADPARAGHCGTIACVQSYLATRRIGSSRA